ncbi:MAG: Holliday junction resolvase RuvX [Clostridiales bacterium]|nr:Holliday junction resolvase RuvX [Clostridiales bacterium]
MGRLLSIDYGRRRTGIAVTDPLRIVASGLTTIPSHTLEQFIREYMSRETVDAIIVGHPTDMHGRESESMRYIKPAIARLQKQLPEGFPIIFYDERFTSVLAHRAMIDGGMKKSDRRDKAIVDEISATILLNDYLQSNQSLQ